MNAIEIHNIEFSYASNSKKHIVNIADLCVKESDQLFIYGPSGSGKSTLLNLICGLHLANSGSINVLGKPLHEMSRRQRDKFRATNIGYIFQQFNLVEYLHAIDNIKLAMHFSANSASIGIEQEIEEMLTTLHLDPKDWYRPVNELSVGQQQRVGIARALINKPKLIIADEPTSSLDQASRDSFISLLLSLCKQHASTLLFVSHDMSLREHFSSSVALTDINSVGDIN